MQRALIIEDSQETLSRISSEFKNNGIDVIECPEMEHAKKALEDNVPFDFVILDWYFALEGDSSYSKMLLKELNNRHFKPIFIYAGTIEDYYETLDQEIDFPRNLISGYSKVISPKELRLEINQKISENYSLQLSETYRSCIHENLERVLFELNSLQNVDIARILRVFFGDGSNIDWSSDLILNLLHRALISDSDFVNNLSEILRSAVNINRGLSLADRTKIANKILYYKSDSDFIRNGDIVNILDLNSKLFTCGIVVTPDCDLEKSKTHNIELIELVNIDDTRIGLTPGQKENIRKFNHDSLYFFPSIKQDGVFIDYVAVLKSKIILQEKFGQADTKYPSATKRHLFTNEFLYNSFTVKMAPVCSKTNPYKSEFMQKLHANNSRVGIPDIKDLF